MKPEYDVGVLKVEAGVRKIASDCVEKIRGVRKISSEAVEERERLPEWSVGGRVREVVPEGESRGRSTDRKMATVHGN